MLRHRLGPTPGGQLSAIVSQALAQSPSNRTLPDWSTFPDGAERSLAEGLLASNHRDAVEHFERALEIEPNNPMAGLNLAEALRLCCRKDEAIAQAKQTLAVLAKTIDYSPEQFELPRYPANMDSFRAEWERAADDHANDADAETKAKLALIRGRLHGILANLTDDLVHFHAAVDASPAISTHCAALGCAMARAKRFAEAVPHLRAAIDADQFDHQAARALFQVLTDLDDHQGRADFARQRLDLHRTSPDQAPLEDWFKKPLPSGKERTSIIVLACNEVEFTRRCLESVILHTRGDYELILVDNGSTDGTAALFEALKSRPGPSRVEVIRNPQNRGYAAGVNQGLAVAQGEYLVLLNNDTVVTPGWLDGLIARSLHQWPKAGMVGPTTNNALPPQRVEAGYPDLTELDSFARKRRRQSAGKFLDVSRITGFCLLIHRAVLEKIGFHLDEQFGLGFFEDDDLCQRVRREGFKLLVAQDVYIHHFGSRTFAGLGIDTERLLQDNLEIFRGKWGNDEAARYRMPARAVKFADTPTIAIVGMKPKVSLCMMVKNEEHNLADCLKPFRGVADEIVVVDTGSTDGTRQLAESLGARVFDSPWQDSFSAARNASIDHARGEWIFWMDADDRIDAENLGKLTRLFAGLDGENRAFVMKCLCVAAAPGEAETAVDHVRLFRNDQRHRWKYRVHEQILPSIRATKGQVDWADVVIRHIGYTDGNLRKKKLERDLRLLHLEQKEQPDDPFTLFNLGSAYQELHRHEEALPALRRSLERSRPTDSIVRKLYVLIAQCRRQLGQFDAALSSCVEGRAFFPDDAELLFTESNILREKGDRRQAIARLQELIAGKEDAKHFASVTTGLRGYRARHNLAVNLREERRFEEAEAEWRKVIAEEPAFLPGYMGLGDVLTVTKRWPELTQHLEGMRKRGPLFEEKAMILEGQAKFERGEVSGARGHFTLAVQLFPQSLALRQLYADSILKEGIDDRAAEQALRDVLALDPNNARAKQNLQVLLSKNP